jgi:hypothetical protein
MEETNSTEKLLEFLITTLKETKTFVAEQAPDVFRQMLEYGVFEAKLGMALSSVLIGVGICLVMEAFKKRNIAKKKREYDNDAWVPMATWGGLLLVIGLPVAVCNYSKIKKIEIAPKLYLMEVLTGR